MVRLTLILSGRPYEEHEFKVFRRLRIGRGEDCEVRIDNPAVSRVQCELLNLGGSYQLRALSKNQVTYVNGSRVGSCTLADGDAISFGKFTVAFACNQAFRTIVRGGAGGGGAPNGERTVGDAAAADKARLESLTKVRGYLDLGDRKVVLEQCFFTIGKDADCDLSLSGWGAPRMGALVLRDVSGFRIIDLSPKDDAVTVNGKPASDRRLSHQDLVRVREREFVFCAGSPE